MTDEMLDPQKLKALQTEVARLPRTAEPPAAAWANIRSAIDREPSVPLATARNAIGKYWQQPVFLAAAAVALIVATTTVTLSFNRKPSAAGAPQPDSATALPQFASQETRYIETANQLQSVVESPDSHLSPETIAKLKESIAVIDGAIAEARAALAADPANKELMDMLSSSYDKKLDLLRRSAAMGRS